MVMLKAVVWTCSPETWAPEVAGSADVLYRTAELAGWQFVRLA